jgi:ABC-type bacteriocin/lantibiotic exporter with double-glycine peptidase domain
MADPSARDNPPLRDAWRQVARLLRLIRGYWVPLLKGMALGVVLGFLGMATPYLSKLLIDEVYESKNVTLMTVIVAGVFAVTAAQVVLGAIRGAFTQYTSAKLSSATSLLFFNHLQHLPARFFDEHRVGEVTSRFSDVRGALDGIARISETLFVSGIYLVIVPPFLFFMQWKLAFVALVTVPATVAISLLTARPMRRYARQSAEAQAALGAYQVEVLSHIRTLKVMALEDEVFAKASQQMQGALRVQLKAVGMGQLAGAVNGMVQALGTAFYMWYAWHLILAQEMTIGDFIAFSAYINYLYNPLVQVVGLVTRFQQAAVNLGRMYEYLDTAPEQDPVLVYTAREPVRHMLRGDIRLRDVTFGYAPGRPILSSLNASFEWGKVTAVVGTSGAGKSSLLRLITRFSEPDSGTIHFGDAPARAIPLVDLRRQLAVVWQEVALVDGSIWENLTLGTQSPSRAEVDEVVRLCHLDQLLSGLPASYDTHVGEWGSTLSGGQKQRIALARAILRNAPVLVLDEATSNIDMETEQTLLRGVLARCHGQTIIFVTHRIASAALADRVLLVAEGRIAASGPHTELLARCDAYRRLAGEDTLAPGGDWAATPPA